MVNLVAVKQIYGLLPAGHFIKFVDFVQGVLQRQEYAFRETLGCYLLFSSGHSVREGKVTFHCLKLVYDKRLGYFREDFYLLRISSSLEPSIWIRL